MQSNMQLISVNVGKARAIEGAEKSGMTGIFKQPARAPVRVTRDGLQGDAIVDTKNHGGESQAVYVYGEPDYAWWAQELGHELAPGTFGENLTIAGLESASFSVGDRLLVGPVVLEATSPRIPCSTLAARMGDPDFISRFRAAERPGLYCRVLAEGAVQAGDRVYFQPYPGETLTLLEMFRDFYLPHLDEAAIRRRLAAPIAIRDRALLEKKLERLLKKS